MLLDSLRTTHNSGRTILFETVYGSKLYGCDLPHSDHDIRGVYAPGLYDFLRATEPRPCTLVPDTDLGESDDILYYPDAEFVDQVLGMKNNCVEIFFAALNARNAGAAIHPMMAYILDQKDVLVSANCSGFIGHARQRCARYVSGDDPRDITLQANKFALATMQAVRDQSPEAGAWLLQDIDGLLDTLQTHDRITVGPNKHNKEVLFIHTRQADLTTRLAEAIKTIESRLERFNRTAEGVGDREKFKDLSTSLRMLETAGDLMEFGTITFPIPHAQMHRDIRNGQYTVEAIIDKIDAAQARAEHFEQHSPLRPAYTQGEQVPIRDEIVANLRLMALKTLAL